VHRNIARFGGNPHNVTIFGESAGGLSVLSQVVSPGARGLFQRAIVESGAYALTEQPLARAERAGAAFAAKAGCARATDAETAACLRGLPVATILADQNATGYQPDVDGSVLTRPIGAALASGHFSRVPLINGTNHDEWRLFRRPGHADPPAAGHRRQLCDQHQPRTRPAPRGSQEGRRHVPGEQLPQRA
jgi:para-nitrobenzyl esterase